MRLLYWYTRFLSPDGKIRKFHGLEKFELNLGANARFHYNQETNCLLCEDVQTPLPEEFWGKGIYNLHVMTGGNGAGKSTIMNVMMDTLYKLYLGASQFDDETIILAEINDTHYLLHLPGRSNASKNISTDFDAYYCRPDDPSFTAAMEALSQTKLIYVTNTLCESDDKRVTAYGYKNHIRYHFLFDCSTCGLIRYDKEDDCYAEKVGDLLQLYFSNETYKQVKFVCAKRTDILEKLRTGGKPAPLPNKLYITIHQTDHYDNTHTAKTDLTVSEQIINRLCAACHDAFIKNLLASHIKSLTFEKLETYPDRPDYSHWKQLFVNQYERAGIRTDTDKHLPDRCLIFVHFLCCKLGTVSTIFEPVTELEALNTGKAVTLSLNLTEDALRWLDTFMNYYRMICSPYYFLDFSWGLSSGETNILRLFSSLYYVFGYKYYESHKDRDAVCNMSPNGETLSLCDTILLFMDEADLTYHPEWQRQFVSLLTAFLPELFNENCGIRDIQILLSTHSPLLIGDIPKNNVSYLSKDTASGQIETFGQNIHLILKDSFFLSQGTVGAFAEEKINSTAKTLLVLISRLKDEHIAASKADELNYERIRKELQDCRRLIDLVAPGVLKNKLLELYWDAERVFYDRAECRKAAVEKMSREKLESLALLYLREHSGGVS